jgi:hypothetical protein
VPAATYVTWLRSEVVPLLDAEGRAELGEFCLRRAVQTERDEGTPESALAVAAIIFGDDAVTSSDFGAAGQLSLLPTGRTLCSPAVLIADTVSAGAVVADLRGACGPT